MYYLTKKFSFCAAHSLDNYIGKCSRIHGHDFYVELEVKGEKLDASGILIDFKTLKTICEEIIELFDHKCLNNVVTWSPSAEHLSRYIYKDLERKLPDEVLIVGVKVWESPDSCAEWREE